MQRMEIREQRNDVRTRATEDWWRERSWAFPYWRHQRQEVTVVVLESALDRESTNSTWIATKIRWVERVNVRRMFRGRWMRCRFGGSIGYGSLVFLKNDDARSSGSVCSWPWRHKRIPTYLCRLLRLFEVHNVMVVSNFNIKSYIFLIFWK